MHSYDGNICYCIEPGTPQDTGDRYTSKDETFWDNLPSDFNSTISPYDMKLFIGRIMQYGYTGPISTSWRSQNASDAETLAQAMATQVLIWETVVGERDEDFNHISPGSYDAVKSVVSTAHPLYSQFISYYNSIEASVQRHSAIPSFMAKTPGKAQNVELAWNGTNYTATLTDSNNVLSNYSFSANEDGISFSVSGNKLVITAATAPSDSVRITASKSGATRRGIITWTDGRYAPGSGIQDVISYAQEVNDPVQAFLNLKVSYGSAKIIKTSEDGKVDNLKAEELKRNASVEGRVKSENRQDLLIVDAINEAINARKKIAFQYFAYNIRKQKKLRHDGERYIFSPYRLIWNGDYYYVLGYSDKHQAIGSFRVDRISARPDILSEEAVPVPADFGVDDFLATTFRMYGSECQEVELICDNSVIDAIIDRFGTDVTIYACDMSTFRVIVRVAISHIFFSWIFGFGGKVRIKGPEETKRQYAAMIRDAVAELE